MTKITEEIIKENLKRIEEGKSLTLPLREFKGNLKRKYNKLQYYKDNKEEIKEQSRKYYQTHKEKQKAYSKKYYWDHKK